MAESNSPGAVGRATSEWARRRLAALVGLTSKPSDGLGEVAPSLVGGQGEPISPLARGRLEPLFGRSLGSVRVHTGSEAEELSDALGADALAIGHHVFGRRDAMWEGGREVLPLLAHEVTHVVQQTNPPLVIAPAWERVRETRGGWDRRPGVIDRSPIEAAPHGIQRALADAEARADDREATAQAVEASVRETEESAHRQAAGSSAAAVDPEIVADRVYRLMKQELVVEMERRASFVR